MRVLAWRGVELRALAFGLVIAVACTARAPSSQVKDASPDVSDSRARTDRDTGIKAGDAHTRDDATTQHGANTTSSDAASQHDANSVRGDAATQRDANTTSSDASQNGDDGGADDVCVVDMDDGGVSVTSTFTVPSNGGHFEVCTLSGDIVAFDFPSSAAGLNVVATSVDPHDRTWVNPAFGDALRDAIVLEPHGTVFSTPVRVRLPASTVAFMFDEGSTGVPDPVLWTRNNPGALDLLRFSTLGILDPAHSCDPGSGANYTLGWNDEPNSGMCSGYHQTKPTWRHYSCGRTPFCHEIWLGCCVVAGAPGNACGLDDALLWNYFHRTPMSSDYPYCNDIGSTPFLYDAAPSPLVADGNDQTITLIGNNLQPGGIAWGGTYEFRSDFVVSTTWISSTQVSAVVRGSTLVQQFLPQAVFVYLNPGDTTTDSAWDHQSNDLQVPVVK